MLIDLRGQAGRLKRFVAARVGSAQPSPPAHPPSPLHGFSDERTSVPFVERLNDDTLQQLNAMLPWKSFTVDSGGRRFGDRRSPWKNQNARPIPDSRVVLADERFCLADKRVLEVGCFEGGHTIGLCRAAAHVVAVDARIVNVVKTMVRCGFYDAHPTVFVSDLEQWDPDEFDVDVVFHVGVLYHLRDPARHVMELGRVCRVGLLLDTHVAEEHEATESYDSGGRSWRFKRYDEIPHLPAAGMYDHARWLTLNDLLETLQLAGFTGVEVVDRRIEGTPRVTIVAHAGGAPPPRRL